MKCECVWTCIKKTGFRRLGSQLTVSHMKKAGFRRLGSHVGSYDDENGDLVWFDEHISRTACINCAIGEQVSLDKTRRACIESV